MRWLCRTGQERGGGGRGRERERVMCHNETLRRTFHGNEGGGVEQQQQQPATPPLLYRSVSDSVSLLGERLGGGVGRAADSPCYDSVKRADLLLLARAAEDWRGSTRAAHPSPRRPRSFLRRPLWPEPRATSSLPLAKESVAAFDCFFACGRHPTKDEAVSSASQPSHLSTAWSAGWAGDSHAASFSSSDAPPQARAVLRPRLRGAPSHSAMSTAVPKFLSTFF